jgi:hypothetical protein
MEVKITVEVLKQLISLDAETGTLTWKFRDSSFFKDGVPPYTKERAAKKWNTRYAGKQAMSAPHRMGYLTGKLLNIDLLAHRVVWAIHYGAWPSKQIDHINGIKTDNRPENLRDVSQSINMRNACISRRNTTGVVGVFYRGSCNKYDAFMKVDGKKKHIGAFDTLEAAAAARKEAGEKYGYHENHGRRAA